MNATEEKPISEPEPIDNRIRPEGLFRPNDVFVPDGGIEHSANMARLIQHFDLARDAEYLARVAVGQDPLIPVTDKRRVKRPRVVEDLLKRLSWLNTPDLVLRKKNYPGLFGVDGTRWITRRELEHLGDKRAWGGKYSEDQMDRALEALASVDIIERTKIYNPENKTSKINIRLCPLAIMDILAGRKSARLFRKKQPRRKRAAPNIAADLIFLKPDMTPIQAVNNGEKVREAARELFYEPVLRKYLLPLSACIKGLPCQVANRADRRNVVEDDALLGFMTMLLKKWAVNPENHEFKRSPLGFTRDAWRALSHDEMKASGFSEAQVVRCRRMLVDSGILEWVNLHSPGKHEPRIYARLRVDLMLEWMRGFSRNKVFLGLPKGTNRGWIPSVIDPRSSNLSGNSSGSEAVQLNHTVISSEAIAPVISDNNKVIDTKVVPKQESKLYPAVAGDAFFSLLKHSQKSRSARLKAPLDSGDDNFRALTGLFREIFSSYFDNPGTPFNHKIATQLLGLANRGAITKRMTVADLRKWLDARKNFDPSYSEEEWKLGQEPQTPEEMDAMLKHWPAIKRLLYRNTNCSIDVEADAPLERWNQFKFADRESDISYMKSSILRDIDRGAGINSTQENVVLTALVALHELGLRDHLTEFIRENLARLHRATDTNPHFAIAILKKYPELMTRELNLPPEHWSKLRQKLQRTFRKVQVRQAQARLELNDIDDLNANWRVGDDG